MPPPGGHRRPCDTLVATRDDVSGARSSDALQALHATDAIEYQTTASRIDAPSRCGPEHPPVCVWGDYSAATCAAWSGPLNDLRSELGATSGSSVASSLALSVTG